MYIFFLFIFIFYIPTGIMTDKSNTVPIRFTRLDNIYNIR